MKLLLDEMVGAVDRVVLDRATEDGRVLVTENVRDFAAIASAAHAGLLLVSARRYRRTPSGMPAIRRALTARLDDVPIEAGTIEWL